MSTHTQAFIYPTIAIIKVFSFYFMNVKMLLLKKFHNFTTYYTSISNHCFTLHLAIRNSCTCGPILLTLQGYFKFIIHYIIYSAAIKMYCCFDKLYEWGKITQYLFYSTTFTTFTVSVTVKNNSLSIICSKEHKPKNFHLKIQNIHLITNVFPTNK